LDPTVAFAIVCALFPALRENPWNLLQLVTEPMCIATWIMLIVAHLGAGCGKRVALEPWERRAAYWYLMNAAVFHFLLDWGVGTLKAFPVMQKQYQVRDSEGKHTTHKQRKICICKFSREWACVMTTLYCLRLGHGHALRMRPGPPLRR
jgi:hypothetical protein